ncbi:MAG TPA: hypothetical protein VKF36_06340 [Syntrophorhabdales bacterium]|nr:hypothetical protein [Syntrophorhabdales bacterium]
MITHMQKSVLVVVIIVAALFVWGPYSALADDLPAGIWTYETDWSIALVNLTDYPLTYLRSNEPGAYPYPWVGNGGEPMLEAGTDWQVDPYRTKMWLASSGGPALPIIYDGRMTLYSKGFKEWAFDLVFVDQKTALHVREHGNWIALSPHSTTQGWAPANTWAYGRWATPVSDNKMHNVMTLIGPKIMVTLFSGDNNNLTVVVQQLIATDASGNVVWDDRNTYKAYYLDFVDNAGSSVPVP